MKIEPLTPDEIEALLSMGLEESTELLQRVKRVVAKKFVFSILKHLNNGPLTNKELKEKINGLHDESLDACLNVLEEHDLVKRCFTEKNGTEKHVIITEDGKEVLCDCICYLLKIGQKLKELNTNKENQK